MSDLPDRRLNAYRSDLAEERLRGLVDALSYTMGSAAICGVPVMALRKEPDLACGTDTEILLGETVRLLDSAGGWAWVKADADGYVGYVPDFAVWTGHGRIEPRLTRLKLVLALTSTGSPWWVVRLVMGDPVRRLLKRGIVTGCAPQARFRMLTLHGMDVAGEETRRRHLLRIDRLIATLA